MEWVILLYLERNENRNRGEQQQQTTELLMDGQSAPALQDVSLQLIIQRLAILSAFPSSPLLFLLFLPLSTRLLSICSFHLALAAAFFILSLPPRLSQVGFKLATFWSPSCFERKYSPRTFDISSSSLYYISPLFLFSSFLCPRVFSRLSGKLNLVSFSPPSSLSSFTTLSLFFSLSTYLAHLTPLTFFQEFIQYALRKTAGRETFPHLLLFSSFFLNSCLLRLVIKHNRTLLMFCLRTSSQPLKNMSWFSFHSDLYLEF